MSTGTRVEQLCDGSMLPDFHTEFLQESDLLDFAKALDGPGFVSLNDWKPVHQKGWRLV